MKRRLPPLLALRAFEAAGRHMSFSKAADELNVTQSAISRQIKLLEEFLRAPLFRRLTRQVELTPFGQNYLSAAVAALDGIERATVQSLQEAKALSVSVLPTLGALWLMQRLTSFMTEHSEIRLEVSSSLEPVNFKRDGIDVALRVGKVPGVEYSRNGSQITFRMTESWDDVAVMHLWDDFITPVCSRSFLAEHGPLDSPLDLAKMPLIHNMRRPDCWQAWFAAVGIDQCDGAGRLDVGHSFMAIVAAREGRGVACVPVIEVDNLDWRDELLQPFGPRLRSAGAYYLLCPKDKALSAEVKLFSSWLIGQYAATG
ncbi:LysR family transcriptional regulator [Paraburkholderia sp. CNPSo 3157]|uniref:LysR family transcriptional regulator n=1 Tax=Paraburkholderia franconis TaxID=2654983 RepID=A0A7X1NCX6_9BURK|nr:LysR substrate-binding domain-containing protein [Paraburkholderia franconis]MPW19246.1 LysR family transcriptional regulator [Paraburkholderia franconis]